MIRDTTQIRPRYGEVDQMGYVYHANYVSYCHQARTELLRKFGISDKVLEQNQIILPVISFGLQYKHPARYDEILTIITRIRELPKTRFHFEFEILNAEKSIICQAHSTVVFADTHTRKPLRVPDFVLDALKKNLYCYEKD